MEEDGGGGAGTLWVSWRDQGLSMPLIYLGTQLITRLPVAC